MASAVQPPRPRFKVEDLGGLTRVIIPSPKHWRPISYSVTQVAIIVFVSAVFINLLARSPGGVFSNKLYFFAMFLVAWAVAGFSLLLTLLWDLTGKEILEITSSSFIIRHDLFGVGDSAKYLSGHIKDLRTSLWHKPYDRRVAMPFIFKLAKLSDNPLAFDYGAKTIRFGNNIDEAEAKQIIAAIQQRFPQYAGNNQ